MNILIIGGSGFIGNKLVEYLAKNAEPLISLDISEPKSLYPNTFFVKGDILDSKIIQRILIEYDVSRVIHLVGLPHIGNCKKNPNLSFQLNALSVQQVLEGIRISDGDVKMLFASSGTLYGNHPKNPVKEENPVAPSDIYSYHKFVAEQIVKSYHVNYGIKSIIFRLFNVYGGNPLFGKDVISIFVRSAIAGEPLQVMGGKKFRDFVYVKDIANAFYSACKKEVAGEIINIGSGTKTTIMEVANIVKKCFPKTKIVEKPEPDDGTGIFADISKAKKLLDFYPEKPKRCILNFLLSFKSERRIS